MTTRALTKGDLWDLALGGSVLSTGGGGTMPTPPVFDAMVDPVFERGLTPQLIEVADVAEGQVVFMPILCGGGVQREIKERYLLRPSPEVRLRPDFDPHAWIQGQISRQDRLYPLQFERCHVEEPPLVDSGDNHWVACHLHPAKETAPASRTS